MIRVRFSPSPTGPLHLGGARTALFNWLFSRAQQGALILRIEDTDVGRSAHEYTEDILRELLWLGLTWEEGPHPDDFTKEIGPHAPYTQSKRLAIYQEYLQKLLSAGEAYPCFCTDEELEEKRRVDLLRKRPPRYDGTCRNLSEVERASRRAEGGKESIRFKMPAREFIFQDQIRGEIRFDGSLIGDFIIFKSNGTPSYNFACAIDDALMQISHVIRGEDHMANTPRQMALREVLGFPVPTYAHISLIVGKDHTKLSKRHGATAVHAYREEGFLPQAVANGLALLGWTPGEPEVMTLAEMVPRFSLAQLAKSPALFDVERLRWFNGQHIRRLSTEALAEAVQLYLSRPVPLSWLHLFVEAIRDNLHVLTEAEGLALPFDPRHKVHVVKELVGGEEARETLSLFTQMLKELAPFDLVGIQKMLEDLVAKRGGAKGKVFKLLRLVLTGEAHGPELRYVILLLGKELCLKRVDDIFHLTG